MPLLLERICRQVCELASETGNFLQQQRGKIRPGRVETKSRNSFVTFVDKESEKRLVKELKKIIPNSGFITEENTISFSEGAETCQQKEYIWLIDPLDGTTNYIHGVPCYCISIGLMKENKGKREMVLGVIFEPNLSEMFYAIKTCGAFLNGKNISVSETKELQDSLLVTGFPVYDYSRMNQYIELFRQLMKRTRGLRRMGSAAVDLAYTACGRFDAFYEYSLNVWDVAAGALIVEEAGGKVTDFNGKNNFLFGKEIIASNGKVHNEMISSVKKYFS